MLDIVETFRPKRVAAVGTVLTASNDPSQHEFFSGMYEEYVGVLLVWEEYIQSLCKKSSKAFYE